MNPGFGKIVCLLVCLVLSGCASRDLMMKRQAEAEAKIERLIQSDRKNERSMGDLIVRLQMLSDQNRRFSDQVKELQNAITELRISRTESAAREYRPPDIKIEAVNQEPAPKSGGGGPPAEYLRAFGLYSANNFKEAVSAFRMFLSRFPDHEYAVNAMYWIGECHYALSDFRSSLTSFQKITDRYPNSPKAPDALLKQGYIQAATGDKAAAGKTFEKLIRRYPGSPAAVKARERLAANRL